MKPPTLNYGREERPSASLASAYRRLLATGDGIKALGRPRWIGLLVGVLDNGPDDERVRLVRSYLRSARFAEAVALQTWHAMHDNVTWYAVLTEDDHCVICECSDAFELIAVDGVRQWWAVSPANREAVVSQVDCWTDLHPPPLWRRLWMRWLQR